jgi:hypothetical protein
MNLLARYFLLKFFVRFVLFSLVIDGIEFQLHGMGADTALTAAMLACPFATCAAVVATCFELARSDELVAMRWAGMSSRFIAAVALCMSLVIPLTFAIVAFARGAHGPFFATAAFLGASGCAIAVYGSLHIAFRARAAIPFGHFASVPFALLLYYAAGFGAMALLRPGISF